MGKVATSKPAAAKRKSASQRKKTIQGLSPSDSIKSKIRSVGNSKGIILSSQILKAAGISEDADISLSVHEGQIIVTERHAAEEVNTELSSWEQQFKMAIKAGKLPDQNLFEGVQNTFDNNEW
jgi:antitoxin component of MazEF toxin-antitoxin module